MMKVIKPGRDQKGWAEEFKCTGKGNQGGGCGAILLVEQDDLFRTTNSCMGETDSFITFRCMACGVLTDIAASKSPSAARSLPSHLEWRKAHGIED
jgi:hypothetical protein